MEALKPTSYDDIRSVWEKTEAKKTGIDAEDQAYATLANSRSWKYLRKYLESLREKLDTRLAESVLKSLGADQIRNDALFSVLGKELINSIINRVEDSASEVENIKNEQRK